MKSLLLSHWIANIVTLVLAVTVWAAIKISMTASRSKIESNNRFQF